MDEIEVRRAAGRRANADAAIRLMADGAKAGAACRYRVGALIELPPAGEVMITGDLHGNRNNFMRIVRAADLSRFTERHLVLQELVHEEDVPRDVACKSYQLVEFAARLKVTFPDRVHLLMGNHEFAELNDLPIAKRGLELNEPFQEGIIKAYGDSWPAVKAAYKTFWRSLPLAVITPNGEFICHSTPTADHMAGITREYLEKLPLGEGLRRDSPAYYLVWGRDYSAEAADKFAEQMKVERLIVAHTPCDTGFQLPSHRHIVLDSSSAAACYLIVPLSEKLTQTGLASRIKRLLAPPPLAAPKEPIG